MKGENGERAKATILFDSGRQKSYVIKDLMNRLKLKLQKAKAINLNNFGSESFRNVVLFDLEAEGGDLVSIPTLKNYVICTPILPRVNVSKFSQLQGFSLADSCNQRCHVFPQLEVNFIPFSIVIYVPIILS